MYTGTFQTIVFGTVGIVRVAQFTSMNVEAHAASVTCHNGLHPEMGRHHVISANLYFTSTIFMGRKDSVVMLYGRTLS